MKCVIKGKGSFNEIASMLAPLEKKPLADKLSSSESMKNARNFPAHGNKSGVTAGFKVNLIYDLLTGLPLFQGLFSGTQQDKKIDKEILGLMKKSLKETSYEIKAANFYLKLY